MKCRVAHWTDFFQGVMALLILYVVSSKIPYTLMRPIRQRFFLFFVLLIALTSIVLRERSRSRLSW
jgi:hypothetical protein